MAKEIICQHHVLNNCLLCACCLHWWAGSRAGGDPDEWALALPPEERQSCTCFILRQDLEELGERLGGGGGGAKLNTLLGCAVEGPCPLSG